MSKIKNFQNVDGNWEGNTTYTELRQIRSNSIAHTIRADEFGSRFDDVADFLDDSESAIADFEALEFLDDCTGIAIAIPVYRGDNSKPTNL